MRSAWICYSHCYLHFSKLKCYPTCFSTIFSATYGIKKKMTAVDFERRRMNPKRNIASHEVSKKPNQQQAKRQQSALRTQSPRRS